MNSSNIFKLARKEFMQNIFNLWIVFASCIFCIINFVVIYFGEIISGDYSQTDIRALSLSLIHLQMYIIPLLSFMLSYDSVLSERESGVLDLILSYRITFLDVLIGKLCGNSIVFSFAFLLGFLPVGIYLMVLGLNFFIILKFICIAVWLGFIFNTFALYISTFSGDRTVVILSSICVWIFFIFIYDILFTLFIILFQFNITGDIFSFILLFNPAEVFRLLSIFYFLPQDANDLFGIDIGVLKISYIFCVMFLWVVFSFLGCMLINIKNK